MGWEKKKTKSYVLVFIIDRETYDYSYPISTNPVSTETDEFVLTRGTCCIASLLELATVEVPLSFYFERTHGLLQSMFLLIYFIPPAFVLPSY